MARVFFHDLLDQLRFSQGDSIVFRQLLLLRIGRKGLAEDRAAEIIGLEKLVDLLGQLFLKRFPLGGVFAVYADQDGIGDLAEITVSQHGADQGVDRQLQVAAAEIHVPGDDLCVFVPRDDLQDLFFLIDFDFDARVHIERHGGSDQMVDLIIARAARGKDKRRRCAGGPFYPLWGLLFLWHG